MVHKISADGLPLLAEHFHVRHLDRCGEHKSSFVRNLEIAVFAQVQDAICELVGEEEPGCLVGVIGDQIGQAEQSARGKPHLCGVQVLSHSFVKVRFGKEVQERFIVR